MSRIALALSLALLTGCGAAPDGEAMGAEQSAITSGTVDPMVTGVVGVLDLGMHTLCSGVLVDERTVITARHCIAEADLKDGMVDCSATKFAAASAASDVVITTSKGAAEPTDRHAIAKVVVPSGSSFCNDDLAVLILAEPLSATVATPIPLALDREIGKGETFTAIGIGRTETDPSGTRRRRDGLLVQCFGGSCQSEMVGAREWWGDGAVCEGDSGGPALGADGRVVGIASRKRAGCTATIYADVASNSAFLRSAMGEVDTTPASASSAPEETTTAQCSVQSTGKQAPIAIGLAFALTMLAARSRRARRPL